MLKTSDTTDTADETYEAACVAHCVAHCPQIMGGELTWDVNVDWGSWPFLRAEQQARGCPGGIARMLAVWCAGRPPEHCPVAHSDAERGRASVHGPG